MKSAKAIMAKLRAMQQPIKRHLWVPADAITFTPQVLQQTFGDGRALFGVGTINSRPAYWIVAGDSSWECGRDPQAVDGATYIGEHIDDILSALEEEFGSADRACPCECGEYEYSGGRYRCPRTGQFLSERDINFPTVNYGGGCHWFRMDWPDDIGVPTSPHPYDGRTKILTRALTTARESQTAQAPKQDRSPEDV